MITIAIMTANVMYTPAQTTGPRTASNRGNTCNSCCHQQPAQGYPAENGTISQEHSYDRMAIIAGQGQVGELSGCHIMLWCKMPSCVLYMNLGSKPS